MNLWNLWFKLVTKMKMLHAFRVKHITPGYNFRNFEKEKKYPVKLNILCINYTYFIIQRCSTTIYFVISMNIVVVHNLENAVSETSENQ